MNPFAVKNLFLLSLHMKFKRSINQLCLRFDFKMFVLRLSNKLFDIHLMNLDSEKMNIKTHKLIFVKSRSRDKHVLHEQSKHTHKNGGYICINVN